MKSISSDLEQLLKTHPSIGIILAAYSGYMYDYQPIIEFGFYVVSAGISLLVLFNKLVDTYWRIVKYLNKKKK